KPMLARGVECFYGNAIARELAVRDRFVNPSEVLVDDPPRSKVEMADLGITHLSFGQTDVRSACAQFATRVTPIELVMERRTREQRGVAIFLARVFAAGINAPSITNNK